MIRERVKIDRDKCNECGNCIPNCHEGALQMVQKALAKAIRKVPKKKWWV